MRRFLCLIALIITGGAFAQQGEEVKNAIIEKRVEYVLENSSEDTEVDFQTLFDGLLIYFDRPINLNQASTDELRDLGLLSDLQINSLRTHIEKNKKLLRIEELQSVAGFDVETIRLIAPFVKVALDAEVNPLEFNAMLKNGKHTVLTRYVRVLEEMTGFSAIDDSTLAANPNRRYLGSADKLYFRYRYQYGNRVSIGLTAEKDAGEQFFKGTQKNGFDYYSAHAYFKDVAVFKHLAIGDYQAQFGQGLTFWSGYSFGKSAEVSLVKRQARIIRPYTSVDENLFLRGFANTVKAGNFLITSFYSKNKVDVNVSFDSLSQELSFTSIQNSGIHGTVAQLEDKDAVSQQLLGGNILYRNKGIELGLTGVNRSFGGAFNPTRTTYSKFRTDTNTTTNVGLNYNVIHRNMNFFGEFSQTLGNGGAMINGLIVSLDPKVSFVVLNRNYARNFHGIATAAIGENSTAENEQGTYIGVDMKPAKRWRLTAYYDQFKFPWLKFQVDGPSRGVQYLAQLTWKPSKTLEVYGRIRARDRQRNSRATVEGVDPLQPESQTNYRINLSCKITEEVRIKTRAEWIDYRLADEKNESGFLIYQDISFQKKGFPLRMVGRYGLFDTDSYDSRIYAYENDVLYFFSIPSYYGKGARTYLMARYDVSRNIKLWVRWAQFYYRDRTSISSGLNEIQGNVKSEVKVQLLVKL